MGAGPTGTDHVAIKTNARKLIALIAAAGIVAGATGAYAAGDNTANFELRRDTMRSNGRALYGQINRVVRGQLDFSPATIAAAEDLVKNLATYNTLFEPGSDAAGSKMKPEALANKADLAALTADAQKAVADLLPAVQSGDKEKIAAAIKPALAACGACHTKYADLK